MHNTTPYFSMYLFRCFLLAAALLPSQFSFAQNFVWAKRMGGTNNDAGHSIAVDPFGNVISTGLFRGTADFDPGPGVQNLSIADGNWDAYIQKLNPVGQLLWVKRVGGTDNDYGVSVTTDSTGNIYVFGTYADVVDFDPGPGAFILEEQLGALFILKLNPEGEFVWVKSFGGYPYNPGLDYNTGDAIKLDANGNIYVIAGFNDTVDFDPGPGTYMLTSAGTSALWDAVILKLNAAGDFVWARRMGSESYDSGISLDVDKQGNVYSTGYFTKTADFDPGPDTFNLVSKGGYDTFIQKLDSSGNFLWAKSLGDLYTDDYGHGLVVDPDGNVYMTGSFNSTHMDFDPGPGVFDMSSGIPAVRDNAYILKLNTDGVFIWAKQMGGTSGKVISRLIRLDQGGDILNIGEFVGTADFDPGPDKVELASFGNNADVYIQKLDPDGNHIWVKQFGGASSEDRSNGMALDQHGDIFATGSFNWSADYDPGPAVYNLEPAGLRDIFIFRIGDGQFWDINGTLFADQNLNGVQDTGESGIPNIILQAKDKGFYTNTSNTGEFHFYYDILGDTIRPVFPPQFWYWYSNPAFAVPAAPKDTLNFSVVIPPGIKDVSISAIEKTFFRPGFTNEVVVEAHNYGSGTADSVWVVFKVNNLPVPLSLVSVTPAPVYASADSVVWLLDSLAPSETATMHLFLRTLTTTPVNSIISFQATAQLENDVYLPNNFFGSRSTVLGAYDPNDKTVYPEHLPIQELDSTALRYVIRFQNTGNLPADFVVIRDTLPWGVDISSLQVISASHPYTWRLLDKGVLELRFDPIFLPDSLSDEPASHGFVAFKVKAKPNLVVGNLITNWAAIYFDYNPPIITNFAVAKITATSAIAEAAQKDWLEFGLSPNPVSQHSAFMVELPLHQNSSAEIRVFDLQGKLITRSSIPAESRQAPINGLPSGSYWVQLRIGKLWGGKLLIVE